MIPIVRSGIQKQTPKLTFAESLALLQDFKQRQYAAVIRQVADEIWRRWTRKTAAAPLQEPLP